MVRRKREEKMKVGILAGLIVAGLAVPAMADPTPAAAPYTPNRCFMMHDFGNWKAADAKTIYIKVGLRDYYRLDLAAPCSTLLTPGSHLVTKVRGSDQVCSGIDWDLSVSDSSGPGGPGGIHQACIVKTQTPLSTADVDAIPRKFKP
jgi:hypothetical protein